MKSVRMGLTVCAVLATVLLPGNARAYGEGTISGTITGPAGQGLPDICVDAFFTDGGWYAASAITESNGEYVLDYLDAGAYKVQFHDCGTEPTYVGQWYDNKPDEGSADEVQVLAGTATTGIDAALAVGGTVTGTVKDRVGNPVPGICAAAFDDDQNLLSHGYADESGAYHVGALPSGTVKIQFADYCPVSYVLVSGSSGGSTAVLGRRRPLSSSAPHGYLPQWYNDKADFASADPVPVTLGETTPGVDAALDVAGGITGFITNAAGEALAGVCVDARSANGSGWGSGWSDDTGWYSVDELPTGDYKIHFTDCNDSTYKDEWYNDNTSFYTADTVGVLLGSSTDAVDAVLARRPRPDLAVSALSVTPIPLSTDQGTLPLSSGWVRDVEVTVDNVGSAATSWADLQVWVTTDTDSAPTYIGSTQVELGAGQHVSKTYRWNGFGSAGDATVHALVCAFDDPNERNNEAEVRSYVVAGGTGFGVTPTPFFGYGYYGCYDKIVNDW
ncbi:MAG: carboxypeptidase-like regulatory domain-containing protein [Actinomycetota bacterium]|nr:carboxypeptidase regulatory-like domain-containing protein [Actinomycetota bacterium]